MSQRYEQEIEEIVRRAGGLRPRTTMRRRINSLLRRLTPHMPAGLAKPAFRITPTRVGGVGAIVLVVGLVMQSWPVIFAALGLLLGAYLLAIGRAKGTFEQTTGYDKTWRGRPVDGPSSPGGPARRWFGRWR
jgi:hypothetical protein